MQREDFTPGTPGTIIPVGDGVAYLPAPLPPVLAPQTKKPVVN
jgi:hypothetical protein